jgi:hypothetical protein
MMKLVLSSLGALIAVIGLAACDQAGPIAVSRADDARSPTTRLNGVALVNAPPSARLHPASYGISFIGPEGGSIEVDGAQFTVPAGALSEPVAITMYGKLSGQYRYKFGPNGLHFAIPATLTIRIDPKAIGAVTDRLAVAVASDDGDDWRVIGGSYDPSVGAVSVPIHHFTQYALCQN